ncbi:amidophosphoribosyltransferase [bacterium]|nr:amidophosphoribosyltransferase [bacterium]
MMQTEPDIQHETDAFRDECGVYGVFRHDDASAHVALGLHALQHRGQEAAGIVACTREGKFTNLKALGLVGDNFTNESMMAQLRGDAAIGHVRYSTTGETVLRNVQPIYAELALGGFAIAHNGNLTNGTLLRNQLIETGSIFQSTMDSEVLIHLVATSKKTSLKDRLVETLLKVEGAYSLVCLTPISMIGVRDPHGVRPLVLGQLDGAYILSSETCGLDIIGARKIRDVKPGELVVIDDKGVHSSFPFTQVGSRQCVFEYIYFARPDSVMDDKSVYASRKMIGAELARENPVDADVVVPVPDSGVPAAIGYADASGIPFDLGIIRNHYVGRTFIEPTQQVRNLGVKLKHNANPASIAGKRVILVDDSIVRGTTSKKIVAMVREAGAKEVHMRIASPPTTHPCFYGVNTPTREELMAANYTVEQMRQMIGVDSLAFLSIDGLYRAMGEAKRNNDGPQYCDACFTGDYAIRLTDFEKGLAGNNCGDSPEVIAKRSAAKRA